MDKQQIIDFICSTPENTNPAVLGTVLDEYASGSGREPVIDSITLTENGTYEADEGVDGYSPITVNVPSGSGYTKTVLWTNDDPTAPFEEDLIITFDREIPMAEQKNTYLCIAYCGYMVPANRYDEGDTVETILANGDYEITVNSIYGWYSCAGSAIIDKLAAENDDDVGIRAASVTSTGASILATVNTIHDISGIFDEIKPYCGIPLQVSLITLNKDDGDGEDEGIILFNGPIAKTTMAELNYIYSNVFTEIGNKIKIIATGLKIDEDEPINFTKNFIFDHGLNNGYTDPIININNKYYMRFDEYGDNNYTRLEILDLEHQSMNSSFSCDNFKMILLLN